MQYQNLGRKQMVLAVKIISANVLRICEVRLNENFKL